MRVRQFVPISNGGAHVNHGPFWAPGAALGPCVWQAWIKPGDAGARYLISEGYGGAHAVLAGFLQAGADTPNRPHLGMWDGAAMRWVTGVEGIAPGAVAHVAYAWDSAYLYAFVGGVPVGRTPCVARVVPQNAAAAGWLFVGGSHHNNLDARVAYVQGWELSAGPPSAPSLVVDAAFRPQFSPSAHSYNPASGAVEWCNFLADYTAEGLVVPDLSPGYPGRGDVHPGQLYGARDDGTLDWGAFYASRSYAPPARVEDPDFDFLATGADPPCSPAPPLTAPPAGCLAFDGFSRPNQSLVHRAPSLGLTEAGSLGPLAWQAGTVPWGIVSGRAAPLARLQGLGPWVDVGTVAQRVEATRALDAGLDPEIALAFRVASPSNYWFVGTFPAGQWQSARIGRVVGSVCVEQYDVDVTGPWPRLRVGVEGATVAIWTWDGSGWAARAVRNFSTPDGGTGAGLATWSLSGAAGVSGRQRVDDFAVWEMSG